MSRMGRPNRPKSDTELKALKKAIKRFGSMSEMAQQLGITRQAITKWPINGIPWHHVTRIEKLTGVQRWKLRPDLWRKPASLK